MRWRGRKKNADESPGPPSEALDGQGLTTHYEALRRAVVDPSRHNAPMHARALLMRKGLAAWTRGVAGASPPAAAPKAARVEQPLPGGVESHLVEILATMALATTTEVIT